MKNEKNYLGFSFSNNMANFEAFRWNISSSINLLFLKSDAQTKLKNFNQHTNPNIFCNSVT